MFSPRDLRHQMQQESSATVGPLSASPGLLLLPVGETMPLPPLESPLLLLQGARSSSWGINGNGSGNGNGNGNGSGSGSGRICKLMSCFSSSPQGDATRTMLLATTASAGADGWGMQVWKQRNPNTSNPNTKQPQRKATPTQSNPNESNRKYSCIRRKNTRINRT
jgi:hypothetical protein